MLNKKIHDLIIWLQEKHPEVVAEMKASNHHFSPTKINPYHCESDVFTHLCMVLLAGQFLGISDEAAEACLFHDLGKPYCRKEKEGEKVAFFGHEPLSAWLAIDYLKELNVSSESIVRQFVAISNHLDFAKTLGHGESEDESIKKVAERYRGFQNILDLMIDLNMADNLGRFKIIKEDSKQSFDYANLRSIFERVDMFTLMKQYKEAKNTYFEHEAILLVGLPGCGKSTWRSQNAQGKNVVCRDDIILEMGKGKQYNEAYHTVDASLVTAELKNRWESHLRKREDVILDMTNLVKSHRNEMLQKLPKTYKKKAIIFLCGWKEMMQRNEVRHKNEGKKIPEKVYYDMATRFTMPSFEEFDEIVFMLDGAEINIF